MKLTREQKMIFWLVWQGCILEEKATTWEIQNGCISTYEEATDYLCEIGLLKHIRGGQFYSIDKKTLEQLYE